MSKDFLKLMKRIIVDFLSLILLQFLSYSIINRKKLISERRHIEELLND